MISMNISLFFGFWVVEAGTLIMFPRVQDKDQAGWTP